MPDGQLEAAAEAIARKMAALPQRAVKTNKLLVNRVYELAGFRDALEYREDPLIKAVSQSGDDAGLNEHLRVLREQGWEAFRQSRDALYRENETQGP